MSPCQGRAEVTGSCLIRPTMSGARVPPPDGTEAPSPRAGAGGLCAANPLWGLAFVRVGPAGARSGRPDDEPDQPQRLTVIVPVMGPSGVGTE